MLYSKFKPKIHSMSDEQLQEILRLDFYVRPPIPIDQINDYLNSMTEEEKLWEEFVFQVLDELVVRRSGLTSLEKQKCKSSKNLLTN